MFKFEFLYSILFIILFGEIRLFWTLCNQTSIMSNFSDFKEMVRICHHRARGAQCLVAEKLQSIEGITVGGVPDNCCAFRAKFPEGYPFAAVSCSCPPDAHGWYETALFGATGTLIYIEELDYENVQRFETLDELVKELKRLYETESNPK